MFKVCNTDNMYMVSREGVVKSLFTGKVLKQSVSKRGYFVVNIRVNGKRRPYGVHQLVADAFVTQVEGKNDVNHKDGNKLNNNDWNLEMCNDDENKDHAWKSGLMKRGEDCSCNGLKESTVRIICDLLQSGSTVATILTTLSGEPINKSTILNIRSYRSWKHISKDYKWELKTKFRNSKASTFNDQ